MSIATLSLPAGPSASTASPAQPLPARRQDLIVRERMTGEAAELVRMPRIGEWQHEAAHIRLLQGRQDVPERNVAVMR